MLADSGFQPEGRDSQALLDEAEAKVFQIAEQHTRGEGFESIKSLLTKAVDRIETLFQKDEPITGLGTGFTDFDQMTSGLQPADLIIVAGRPSMGKTTFAMNVAENVAIQSQVPVAVFSMEMPGESLAMRMMSSLGRIDQHRVRTGKLEDDEWPRLTSAVSILAEAPLFIDDTPALSPIELRARARRLKREHGGLGLIVIDYLQLMQVPGTRDNRTTEISEISRNLKALAKELEVPVVALSQLNRGLEQRTDKRPVMSDLRESGAIEQDADLIAFIYRDVVYNKETEEPKLAELEIAKQRNGPTGEFDLHFHKEFTRFSDLAPVSHDAHVTEQSEDVGFVERGDGLEHAGRPAQLRPGRLGLRCAPDPELPLPVVAPRGRLEDRREADRPDRRREGRLGVDRRMANDRYPGRDQRLLLAAPLLRRVEQRTGRPHRSPFGRRRGQ